MEPTVCSVSSLERGRAEYILREGVQSGTEDGQLLAVNTVQLHNVREHKIQGWDKQNVSVRNIHKVPKPCFVSHVIVGRLL